MKNLKLLLAIVSIGAITTFSSCSDDDDSGTPTGGGNNNQQTNLQKLTAQDWELSAMAFNGNDVTGILNNGQTAMWSLSFNTNGSGISTGGILSDSLNTASVINSAFTWTFNTDETQITLTKTGTSDVTSINQSVYTFDGTTLNGSRTDINMGGVSGTLMEVWVKK